MLSPVTRQSLKLQFRFSVLPLLIVQRKSGTRCSRDGPCLPLGRESCSGQLHRDWLTQMGAPSAATRVGAPQVVPGFHCPRASHGLMRESRGAATGLHFAIDFQRGPPSRGLRLGSRSPVVLQSYVGPAAHRSLCR